MNVKDEGIATHVYVDGDEILLNIVDENSSVLVTFFSEEAWEKFKETVNSFDVDKNPSVSSLNQERKVKKSGES